MFFERVSCELVELEAQVLGQPTYQGWRCVSPHKTKNVSLSLSMSAALLVISRGCKTVIFESYYSFFVYWWESSIERNASLLAYPENQIMFTNSQNDESSIGEQ